MSNSVKNHPSDLMNTLKDIEREIRDSPSFLSEGGKGVDDPAYYSENRRLEALEARLSTAIRKLQRRPQPKGSGAKVPQDDDLLLYARRIEKELRGTYARANTRSLQEILADAEDQLHEYHEMTAVPPELSYTAPGHESHAYSLESACILIFSLVAGVLQMRRRRGKK
jgi:hypothetical protein